MNAHKIIFLSLISAFVVAADPDWRLVENASPDGQAWVDVSAVKFDGGNVTATYKWEYQGGIGYYLISANCGKSTITRLGGEFRNKNGALIKNDPENGKPIPAPSGTFAGNIHRFVCDLRPVWRKWLQ